MADSTNLTMFMINHHIMWLHVSVHDSHAVAIIQSLEITKRTINLDLVIEQINTKSMIMVSLKCEMASLNKIKTKNIFMIHRLKVQEATFKGKSWTIF